MNAKFVIERLPSPERVGDWHDKPLRWIAKATDPYLTQKFATKRNAQLWTQCVRRASNFNEAQRLYQNA